MICSAPKSSAWKRGVLLSLPRPTNFGKNQFVLDKGYSLNIPFRTNSVLVLPWHFTILLRVCILSFAEEPVSPCKWTSHAEIYSGESRKDDTVPDAYPVPDQSLSSTALTDLDCPRRNLLALSAHRVCELMEDMTVYAAFPCIFWRPFRLSLGRSTGDRRFCDRG